MKLSLRIPQGYDRPGEPPNSTPTDRSPRFPNPMTLEAVFLDVGQTLLTEFPSRFALYADAARARGIDAGPKDMRQLMVEAHHGLPKVLNGAFRYSDPWFEAFIGKIFCDSLGLERSALPKLAEELFARFENPESFRLYPGARDLLARLREHGLALGVISNWSARLPRLLRALELETCFDFVVCSALEGVEKPDPRIFELALERAGVAAERALHAGDHPEKDVAGARAVGLQAVRVEHREGAPEGASPCVHSLSELEAFILGGSAS